MELKPRHLHKDGNLHIRINKEVKAELSKMLQAKGSNINRFLMDTIFDYIEQENEKECR